MLTGDISRQPVQLAVKTQHPTNVSPDLFPRRFPVCLSVFPVGLYGSCAYRLLTFLWWRGGATGKVFGLAISRSRVQILLEATLRNNIRQVVYTYVPQSPSSITWYQPKGGDALRLGR